MTRTEVAATHAPSDPGLAQAAPRPRLERGPSLWMDRPRLPRCAGPSPLRALRRLRPFRPMLYRRRVIPRRLEELWGLSPRLAEALARKESCDCAACGAKLRCRRMARAVLALYPVGEPPAPSPSLARWVECAGDPHAARRRDQPDRWRARCPPPPAALRAVRLSARRRPRLRRRRRPLGGPDATDVSRRLLRPGAHVRDARARPRPRRGPRRDPSRAGARRAACLHGARPAPDSNGPSPRDRPVRMGAIEDRRPADRPPRRRLGLPGLHRVRRRPARICCGGRASRSTSCSARRARTTWRRSMSAASRSDPASAIHRGGPSSIGVDAGDVLLA